MSADGGLFSAEQVCTLAHITERQLRTWARDFYRPEYGSQDGRPFTYVYSFRDIVSLRTIGALRNKHRIPLKALKQAGEWLSERHDAPWSSLRFRVSGRGLYYVEPGTKRAVALTGPLGQHAIPGVLKLDAIASQVRRAVKSMRARKANEIGKVTRERNVAGNAWVVAGTRIPTATIWRYHLAGYTHNQIITEFPRLRRPDIDKAIEHEKRLAS